MSERAAEIRRRVEDRRHAQGSIGLLERIEALRTLTANHFALLIAVWLVRFFFIAIDCLPVVVKILGGTSTYDRLLLARMKADEDKYTDLLVGERIEDRAKLQILQHRVDRDTRKALADLDHAYQDGIVAREAEQSKLQEDLYAKLRERRFRSASENGRADHAEASPLMG